MKSFKNFESFKSRLENGMSWDDYFKLGGKIWYIYEYGGGSLMHMDYDYVYFSHKDKKTGKTDLIYVKYICPSYQWVDGKKIQRAAYRFIDAEFQEDAWLWR